MTSVGFREETQVRAMFEEEKCRCGSNYDEETNNNNQAVVDTDSDETPEGSHDSWEESAWTKKKGIPWSMPAPPGRPSYIAKDSNSLTFQWEAAPVPESDSNGTTTAAAFAFVYEVEIQQVDVVPGSLTPSSKTARTLVDESKWQRVYCGKERWTQVKKLRPGSYYAVRICAAVEKIEQKSEYSEMVVLHTTPTIPSQMEPPQLAGLKHDALELQWSPPWEDGGAEVTGYRLQMCPPPGAPLKKQEFAEVYVGPECTTYVTDLSPCVKYKAQVKAINDVGEGSWSLPSCFTTKPSLPEVPQNLHAVALAPGHVELEWSLARRNGRDRDHYEIEVENVEQGICEYASIGQSHSCDIEGLECGRAYRFRVRAENETGSSDWSALATLCLAPCPPGPPSTPFVTAVTDAGIGCTWYPPQVLGSKTTIQYQAEVICLSPATDKGSSKQAWQVVYQGSRCDCLLNGLLPGSMYCLRVVAWNEAGWGAPSLPLHFEMAARVPQKPLMPHAVERSHQLMRLSWVAPLHDGGRPVEKYRLQICSAQQLKAAEDKEPFADIYEGSKTSFDLTELIPGCVYGVRVCAINAVGVSEWSDIGYESVPLGPPPCPHSLQMIHRGSRSLHLRWEGGASTDVTYIVAQAKSSRSTVEDEVDDSQDQKAETSLSLDEAPGFQSVYSDSAAECLITDLEPRTRYLIKVKATNADGESDWSAVLVAETDNLVPSTPTKLQVWETTCTAMHLSWRSGDPTVDGIFSLELKASSEGHWSERFRGKETECTLEELEAGEEYLVRIQEVNENGSSPYSQVVSVVMDSTEPSTPETPSVAQMTCSAIRINWNAPLANGRPILYYRVEVQGGDGSLFEVEVPSSKHFVRIGDLSAQTDYVLRLAAVNDKGSSDWSPAVTATTKMAPPPTPCEVKAALVDAQSRNVKVMWKMPELTEKLCYDVEALISGNKKTKGSAPMTKATVSSTVCDLEALERNVKYEIRVRATTLTGVAGKWSEGCMIRISEEPSVLSTSAKGTTVSGSGGAVASMHELTPMTMTTTATTIAPSFENLETPTMRRPKKGQAIVATKTKNPLKKRKSCWNVLGPYISAIVVFLAFFLFVVLCLQE